MSDQSVPKFLIPADGAAIHITIPLTDAAISNPGIIFNQAGITFNQAGITFGGLYQQNQDVVPTIDIAYQEMPHIFTINDVGTHPSIPPGPNNQTTVGPGWFMYVSQ